MLPEWESKLREIVPSYGQRLSSNLELCEKVTDRTASVLGLPA